MSGPSSGKIVRLDAFEFDLEALVLSREGRTVPLQPQPSRVLAELIRANGGVVTRDHLRDTIWGDRFVEFDQSLNYCIRQIRAALGDGAEEPRFVETIPRRGYRLMVPARPSDPGATVRPRAAATWRQSRWLWGGAVVVATLGVLGAVRSWGGSDRQPVAETRWDSAAGSLPSDARVAFLAGRRWLEARTADGYRNAVERFSVTLQTDPRFVPARLGRAEGLLWMGRVDEARSALDSILGAEPDLGHAHTIRGALALFRDWDFGQASLHLRRGAELEPRSSVGHHYLAYLALLLGERATAKASIDTALALDPLSPTLQGDAGLVHYWLGNFEEAKALCTRSLANAAPSRGSVYCLWLIEWATGGSEVHAISRRLAAGDGAPAAVVAGLDGSSAGMARYLDWEAERLRARPDGSSGTALPLARVLALGGRLEAARAAIVDGFARHSNSIIFAAVDPLLGDLRRDPEVERAIAANRAGRL